LVYGFDQIKHFNLVVMAEKNIIIRDWGEADFECYKSWNVGYHKWMAFNGPYYPQKTKEEIEREIILLKTKKNISRKVVAFKETNELIGTVSWYWQSIETNWMSVGLAIYDDQLWGQGIGRQALDLWTDYLFDNRQELVRLDLRTWSGNIGMMKIAEKVGYKLEARFRKARIVNDQFYDGLAYGILREERCLKGS